LLFTCIVIQYVCSDIYIIIIVSVEYVVINVLSIYIFKSGLILLQVHYLFYITVIKKWPKLHAFWTISTNRYSKFYACLYSLKVTNKK